MKGSSTVSPGSLMDRTACSSSGTGFSFWWCSLSADTRMCLHTSGHLFPRMAGAPLVANMSTSYW